MSRLVVAITCAIVMIGPALSQAQFTCSQTEPFRMGWCDPPYAFCPNCPRPRPNTYCTSEWLAPSVPAGDPTIECIYSANPTQVNSDSPVTVSFSNVGTAGSCDLPDAVEVGGPRCSSGPQWMATCRGGGRFKVSVPPNPNNDIFMPISVCCREIGDSDRCSTLQYGQLCPQLDCNIGCSTRGYLFYVFQRHLDDDQENHIAHGRTNTGDEYDIRADFPRTPLGIWNEESTNPVSCIFNVSIKNTFTITGAYNPAEGPLMGPGLVILGRAGAECFSGRTSATPFDEAVPVYEDGEPGTWGSMQGGKIIWFDNAGCSEVRSDFWCRFPALQGPDQSSLEPLERRLVEPNVEFYSSDSARIQVETCCCAGDSVSCCMPRPLLVE